jgi:hypothetical protein
VNAEQEFPASEVPDIGDIPLDTPVQVTGDDYARVMRRIGLAEGEPGTSVSAFNSSI